jgi:NADH-quinone oxidoreductase subunit E
MNQELADILARYKDRRGSLIPILQEAQARSGYLSEEALSQIARFLGVSRSEIFGVATFYSQFRFTSPGQHTVKVCLGTSCYVRGGAQIMSALEQRLGIEAEQTTPDLKFNLERVACFGCCALSPIIVADDKVYSRVTPEKAKQVISSYE